MKKIVLSISAITFGILSAFGQGGDISKDLGNPGMSKPASNTDIANPVDLSTGVIAPRIHLTQLESFGGQTMNVDLVYTSGQGVRVKDVASRVGLGWEIETGGFIKRIVKGIRDEKKKNIWYFPPQIPPTDKEYDSDNLHDVGWLADDYHFFQDDVDDSYFDLSIPSNSTIAEQYFDHFFMPPLASFPLAASSDLGSQQLRAILLNYMMPGKDDYAIDNEPDIFMFKAGSYSGKFVFNKHREIVLMPHQDIKIELPERFGGPANQNEWIITTPDGIKYIFEDSDNYRTRSRNHTYYAGGVAGESREHEYISEWHLKKIVGFGNDLFTFTYNAKPDYSISFDAYSILKKTGWTIGNETCQTPMAYCCLDDLYDCPNPQGIQNFEKRIAEKELAQVSSPFGSIVFENETDPNLHRKDMWVFTNWGPYYRQFALKYIKKFNSLSQMLKKFEFETGYFNGGAGNFYDNIDPANEYEKNLFQSANLLDRLKLTGLYDYPCNGTGTSRKYSFEYEESQPIYNYEPKFSTKNQDWWGFFKDGSLNSYTLCNYTPSNQGYGLPEIINAIPNSGYPYTPVINGFYWMGGNMPGGIDKSPTIDSKALVLKKITSPSGLETNYLYEQNETLNTVSQLNEPHGGLRIKQITNIDIHNTVSGSAIETEYFYTQGEKAPERRKYDFQRFHCSAVNYHLMLQNLTNPYRENASELVRYKQVEVKTSGSGKTITYFTGFSDQPDLAITRKHIDVSGSCESCMEDAIKSGATYNNLDPPFVADVTDDYDDDPGAPLIDMSYRRGLPLMTEYYQEPLVAGPYAKVKSVTNVYLFDEENIGFMPEQVSAYRVNSSYHFTSAYSNPAHDHAMPEYNVDIFKYHSGIVTLVNTTESTYEMIDGVITNTLFGSAKSTQYAYVDGHPTLLRLKQVPNISGNGNYFEQYKYAFEYDITGNPTDENANGIKELLLHGMGNTPVEVITGFMDGSSSNGLTDWISGGKIVTFRKHGIAPYSFVLPYQAYKMETQVALDYFTFNFSSINGSNQFVFDPALYKLKKTTDVDNNGRDIHTKAEPDGHGSALYGYDGTLVVATFSNADVTGQECSFEGFEHFNSTSTINAIGWNSNSSTVLVSTDDHTGNTCRKVTNTNASLSGAFTPRRQNNIYKFSAWIKTPNGLASSTSGEMIIELKDGGGTFLDSKATTFGTTNDWTFIEVVYDLEEYRIIHTTPQNVNLDLHCSILNHDFTVGNDIFVDDIRFSPLHCNVTTYTYDSRFRITSTSDAKSLPVYNNFDEWDRVHYTTDKDDKLLSVNEYYLRPWNSPYSQAHKHSISKYSFKDAIEWNDFPTMTQEQYVKSITYMDDFMRPLQSLSLYQSPLEEHITQHIEYNDINGLKPRSYLPYTKTEDSYDLDGYQHTLDFYQSPPPAICETRFPYSESVFDRSPLARAYRQGSPGEDWQPVAGTNPHSVRTDISVYEPSDPDVYKWIPDADILGFPGARGILPGESNWLSKIITTDEDGNVIKTYIDNLGNTILKRAIVPSAGDPLSGKLHSTFDFTDGSNSNNGAYNVDGNYVYDTYYVYDDFMRKMYEIPSAAVQFFKASGNSPSDYFFNELPNGFVFNHLIYAWRYDEKGRIKARKSPGINWTYYVYDENDRVILSQDPKQAAVTPDAEWSFSKYDEYGRTVMTGIYKSNDDQPTLQGIVDNGYINNTYKLYEKRDDANGPIDGYTNKAFPTLTASDFVLTVDYYDIYNSAGWSAFTYAGIPFTATPIELTFGEKTGQIVRTLNGPMQEFLTVYYYDDNYNVIQEISDNQVLGNDIYYRNYSWDGKLLNMRRVHSSPLLATGGLTFNKRYTYDHAGRLQYEYEQIAGDPEIELAHMEYNEIGQLIRKSLHSAPASGVYMQNIDYRYNERGWIKSINNSTLTSDPDNNPDDDDAWGEELLYTANDISGSNISITLQANGGFSLIPRYNGNVSAMMWKHKSPGADGNLIPRDIYGYRYDALNRLTASYYARTEPATQLDFNIGLHWFDEKIAYDVHGNPNSLIRSNRTNPIMDKIVYGYEDVTAGGIIINSNRLKTLDEVGGGAQTGHGFTEPASQLSYEYAYDDNGSVTDNYNKELTVEYTYFDLPITVTKTNPAGTIHYTYDATGEKLTEDAGGVIRQYVDGIEYYNGNLEHVMTSEGRFRPKNAGATNVTDYVYDYMLKDHVDNVRVVLTEEVVADIELASMEEGNSEEEEETFLFLPETRDERPANAPQDETTTPNEEASILNAAEGKTLGHSKIIPMAQGESIDIDTKYFFESASSYSNANNGVQNIISQLGGLFSTASGEGMESQNWQEAGNNSGFVNFLTTALGDSDSTSTAPKAFLTWLFFDREFNFIETSSGILQAEDADELGELGMMNIAAPADGYMYVYVSNESGTEVMFDNLRIGHTQGVLLQWTHYYPYGLPIKELSSMYYLRHYPENMKLMTTKEWNTEYGLNEYDFGARSYDPASIRWSVMDPAEQFYNPYFAMGGNPVVGTDPDGTTFLGSIGLGALWGAVGYSLQGNFSIDGFAKAIFQGAVSGAVGFGVGSAFGEVGKIGNEIGRALMHAQTQTVVGGVFGQAPSLGGYLSASFGSLTGSALEGVKNPYAQIGGSMMAGGIGSEIGGGSFWKGAVMAGLIVTTNHLMQHARTNTKSEKVATRLAKKYLANEKKILAKSLVLEALLEITDPGQLLTVFRTKIDEVYGNQQSHDAHEVYSTGIKVLKNIKNSFGNGKVTDSMLYSASAGLASEILLLQVQNGILSSSVQFLDKNVYSKYINRSFDTRFGGGGARGNY